MVEEDGVKTETPRVMMQKASVGKFIQTSKDDLFETRRWCSCTKWVLIDKMV